MGTFSSWESFYIQYFLMEFKAAAEKLIVQV
jgi:hypothetical protein